ncbi:MAG: hypothetical protein KKA05_01550 [Alphaproteobacteria bacterium]|nr:hypothetical protein [Alphaproteobacteria bacterium]MBU0858626.1 hypothetical protein [Alphaproteobacteria bacterium]
MAIGLLIGLGCIAGVAGLKMRGTDDDLHEGDDLDEVPAKPAKAKKPRAEADEARKKLMQEMGKKGAAKRWAKKQAAEAAASDDSGEADDGNVQA